MKALRWHGRKDVRLEDVQDAPPPQPHEIRIDVEWCGICGTDVEEYLSGPLVIPTMPHPLSGFRAPLIIGHEVVGRVRDCGSRASGLMPGQLVGVEGSFFCGECRACRHHQYNVCEKWAFIGMSYPGGLAERMTIPYYMAIAIDTDIPAEWVSVAEPLSVAVRAVRRGRFVHGESVAVLGAGTIGLAILQVARNAGAKRIITVDKIPFRRRKSVELGADESIDASGDLVGTLREKFDVGPDILFDCTGSHQTPQLAVQTVRLGGRVVQVGLPTQHGEMNFLDLALREVELIGTVGHIYDEDYRTAVELISSQQVNVERLITHRLPLTEGVSHGIAFLAGQDSQEVLKILITPQM